MKSVLIATLSLFAMFAIHPVESAERTFPTRTVRIIVPASQGTGADIVARLLGQRLSEVWGQPVVIENRDGASGSIGAAAVAKAPPDGYTLVMAFVNHAISPSLYSNIPFDILRDFKPIVRTSVVPLVIFAHPSFPANSIPELITLAKSRSSPDTIFFGSPGVGSVNGLSIEMLKQKANLNLTQAPYKGSAQMLTDILGNQIPMGASVIAAILPQIKTGKLKALGVTTKKRSSSLPNVPTVAEAGIEDYEVMVWNGLLAPANTPDAIVAEIYAEVVKVAQTREFREQLQKLGMEPSPMNPTEFKNFFAAEVMQWSKIVKESGVKAD